ncbi:hypothetical protein GCM10012287_40940 [Streptomyces daqingensis]|uniref:Uncharacterized protein n=1 Tax=Streptomyces daqingensis TaxID=1472640 RepID=A0ABQ2MKX0_9ACTN|nr:hypothetical protein GCM10012287_40940 [Streptomyces daqingensis]
MDRVAGTGGLRRSPGQRALMGRVAGGPSTSDLFKRAAIQSGYIPAEGAYGERLSGQRPV